MRPFALALGAALIGVTVASARADEPIAQPVDLALVLLTDVSNSMDGREYAMVKDGYKAAFADPQVIQAILGNSKGVAIAYVEFSGKDEFVMVKGWDVLTDAASARAFGNAVALAERSSSGNTALAPSLRKAVDMLQADASGAPRRVIDVASDHPHDGGRTATVRDLAVASGITINALPIIDDRPIGTFDGHLTYATQQWGHEDQAAFYRNHAFGEALKRKLLRELISSPEAESVSGSLAAAE
jgi:hypothetical protein